MHQACRMPLFTERRWLVSWLRSVFVVGPLSLMTMKRTVEENLLSTSGYFEAYKLLKDLTYITNAMFRFLDFFYKYNYY